jgi:hypothetical protein
MSRNVWSSLNCSHISCRHLLAKHPWIASRVRFQSFECERTHAPSLAWHDQTQRPYTWTEKTKHWKQAKKYHLQNSIKIKRSYLFKTITAMNNSTSPLYVLSKIESTNMSQDGSSPCDLLMYDIQVWM